MADATTLPQVSPKQLGKQLRAVRRRKGLSLSEVARGAGLSRRELVAYERGKVEIPESDLWVIAGSCGVDVAELVPPTDPLALPSAPDSIEDTISQLRRAQPGDGLQRHLDTLHALRALPAGSVVQLQEGERASMAAALGGDPSSIERRLVETMRVDKHEAKRLRALVLPDAPRYSPLALDAPAPQPAPVPPLAPPIAAPAPASGLEAEVPPVFATNGVAMPDLTPVRDPDLSAGPVDVFEELAKLPEPVALPDPDATTHDLLAPPPEPVTVAAGAEAAAAAGPFAAWSSMRSALPEPSSPVVVDPVAATTDTEAAAFGASHAPPIDVVGRIDAPQSPIGWLDPDPPGANGFAPAEPASAFDPGAGAASAPAAEPTAPSTGGWDAWWQRETPSAAGDASGLATPAAPPLEPPAYEPHTPQPYEAQPYAPPSYEAQPYAPPSYEAPPNGSQPYAAPAPVFEAADPSVAFLTPEAAPAPFGATPGPDVPPAEMVEFVDEYVVAAPEVPDGDAAGPPPVAFGGFGEFTQAAYASPFDAPMTDAERFAAGTFDPAPADASFEALPMTDAERAVAGAWPSWDPAPAEPAGASDAWAADAATATDADAAPAVDLETPWGHQTGPDAGATGFYVDWGPVDTADTAHNGAVTDTSDDPWVAAALDTHPLGAPSAPTPLTEEPPTVDRFDPTATFADVTPTDAPSPTTPTDAPSPTTPYDADAPWSTDAGDPRPDPVVAPGWEPATAIAPEVDAWTVTEPVAEPVADTAAWVPADEPAPISWRPLADSVFAAVAVEMASRGTEADTVTEAVVSHPEPVAAPAPEPVEEFVAAGEEWELGNALPLVEVRGEGGLVMRRADERWALADLRSTTSFALEVDVDFRSGPGFGVLFRASTDADGHMSGYSFDVDPIHEGGSYLVRQWQADRELWNPIAHVPAGDPADMHGELTLRLVVLGDAVTASVNDTVVLTVDSLERACVDRNREPANGDRVGIQAWSSSDLVIDSLRVAER